MTLATLPEGDALSFTKLQELIGLTPGNLITHQRKLEEVGYIEAEKSGIGASSLTKILITALGRQALSDYSATLRDLLSGL